MSWINVPENHEFPIQNLPYGVFSRVIADPCTFKKKNKKKNKNKKNGKKGKKIHFEGNPKSCGVRIGDMVLDLRRLEALGYFKKTLEGHCFQGESLNDFMARTKEDWSAVRKRVTQLLSKDCDTIKENKKLRKHVLVPIALVRMHLPAQIGDYTDFYASMDHAKNVSEMFRGAPNLLPNWKYLPVGYHGRASSVVVSGHDVRRPHGQSTDPEDATKAVFGTCKRLDFELEIGCFVGGPGKSLETLGSVVVSLTSFLENPLGTPVKIEKAEDRLFGLVILNDWSARDIQKWEYVPLGPFGAKNFQTTISPWVVTFEALQPFLCGPVYPQDPKPFPYLADEKNGNYDVNLLVKIKTEKSQSFETLSTSNMKYLYWTFKQQLVHHSITGCNMRAGDLLGSGTISGAKPEERGSILELAWAGKNPIKLSTGEERKFLEDGDTLRLEGFAQGKGYKIGFGVCDGKVLPAK